MCDTPGRIRILERIIEHIRIPVETLRIGRAGDNRIRLDEAAQSAVVVPRIVKVQADRAVVALTGELVSGGTATGACAAPGIVPLRGIQRPIAVRRERRRSQVITGQVGRRIAAYAHRHSLTAGVVVLDHRGRAAGPLEVGADVVGGHAAHYGFDAVAVAVVGEAGAGRAAYSRQAVFGFCIL